MNAVDHPIALGVMAARWRRPTTTGLTVLALVGAVSGCGAHGAVPPHQPSRGSRHHAIRGYSVFARRKASRDEFPAAGVRALNRQIAGYALEFGDARRIPTSSAHGVPVPAWAIPGPNDICVAYAFPVKPGKPRAFGAQCEPRVDAATEGVIATFGLEDVRKGTINLGIVPDDVRSVLIEGREIPSRANAFAIASHAPIGLTLIRRDGSRHVESLRGF